jgi:Leucine-rich repeat (LRR) protein
LINLDLSDNQIAKIDENSFICLTNLKFLNLNKNCLISLYTNMFHGLKNLQVLNLSDNKISTIDDAFIELSSLISLNLSNNELTKINSKTIRNLKIKELHLNNNLIENDINFVGLFNLIRLDLQWNKITEIFIPNGFKDLFKLQELNLKCNKIDKFYSFRNDLFRHFKCLLKLDVSWNKLKNIETFQSQEACQLEELILNNNLIEIHEDLHLFNGLSSLKKLDLSWNNINKINFLLKNLIQLEELNIQCNKITYIGYLAFLKEINLAYNPIEVIESNENNLNNLKKVIYSSKQYDFLKKSFINKDILVEDIR